MADKKVVAGSDITARQMKEFWRQADLGKINRGKFQLFLETGVLETQKTVKLELEDENFRVDSSGWQQYTDEQDITYLENPEKDISKYVAGVPGELIGQQLFTWGAAMRETAKAGKRMPTDNEWNLLGKDLLKGCLFSGNCNTNGSFYSLGFYAYFWSSSVSSGGCAWSRLLSPSYSTVNRDAFNSMLGFSVRCLKDW